MQDGMIHEKKKHDTHQRKIESTHSHTQCLMKAENTQKIMNNLCSYFPCKPEK